MRREEDNHIILHVFPKSVFLRSFIQFLKRNYNPNDHIFITFGSGIPSSVEYPDYTNDFKIIDLSKDNCKDFNTLRSTLEKVDTSSIDLIILHSFRLNYLDKIYFLLHPRHIRKTVWVIWGYDLYDYKDRKRSYKSRLIFTLKKLVVRKIPYVVARSPDYKRLQQWYGSSATHINVEPLYGDEGIGTAPRHSRDHASRTFNIILGNSATETNRHLDALEVLSKYQDDDIKIHIPLSYGDAQYAEIVKTKAKSIFGEKVVFLEAFMSPEEYRKYLAQMDIGIFNNNRQQAMGNLEYLFATGAKIYLNEDSPLWEIFTGLNFAVHSINNLGEMRYDEFIDLEQNELDANSQKAREIYSEEHGVMCWNRVFALADRTK